MRHAVLRGVMANKLSSRSDFPRVHCVALSKGDQAVINGAIVTASGDCTLEVGSGAFVLTGHSLWQNDNGPRHPREELYFSMLDASGDKERFTQERFRLFALLSQVVAQERSHEAQKECAQCAHALMIGNAEEATRSASRLASQGLKQGNREGVAHSERMQAGRYVS